MWTGTRVPRNTGFPPTTLPFNRSWSALGSSGLARPGRRRCARFQKQSEKIKRCGKPFKGSRIQRVSGPVPKSRYLHNCPACAAGGGRGDAGGRDRLSPRRARRGLRPSSEWALLAAVSNEPGRRRWGSLESVVLLMGDRGFESTSLQRRVLCEPEDSPPPRAMSAEKCCACAHKLFVPEDPPNYRILARQRSR